MMTRKTILSVFLLLALSGGCAAVIGAGGGPGRPQVVTAVAVPLDRDRPGKAAVGPLRFLGALDIAGGDTVGGLSGLWVAPAGDRFVAIGDTGLVVDGRLDHDGGPASGGRLTGVHGVRARPLAVEEGVSHRKRRTDAEDLTRLPDGGWLVTLERDHRILRYPPGENGGEDGGDDGPRGTPTAIPLPPGVADDAPENGGLETLTRLSNGRLLTIEEGADDGRQERRAWVARDGIPGDGVPRSAADWQGFTYRAAPRYRPTAAAPLPDGGALVLEREVSLLGGWSSRIVRLTRHQLRAGAVVDGEELGRLESPLLNDNFEGMATRPGREGETLVYLVSDNNFSSLQRTYLALFALSGPAP